MTKVKAITAAQARAIGEKTGFPISWGNGRTFYGTDEGETGIWEFDSKRERDAWVARNNK